VQVVEFSKQWKPSFPYQNFLLPCTSHEVVHFSVHGAEIFSGNLGRNVKICAPPEISLTYSRNSGGQKFRPRAGISAPSDQPIKGGVGVKIPFGIFFHPRPSLSKPPPPSPQVPLRRLPSRRNPRISLARALLDVGSPSLRVVFAMDDDIVPNLSP
jgi:hypothetical protein